MTSVVAREPTGHRPAGPVGGYRFAARLRAGTRLEDLGNGATASRLSGARLFLQHGPINLVVRAEGRASAVKTAHRSLMDAFPAWLGELAAELPVLRAPAHSLAGPPRGPIARRMYRAVRPHRGEFVTAMAAVAGAVADQALAVLAAVPGVERAFVNNGGDIAFHLVPGASMSVGIVASLRDAAPAATVQVDTVLPVRGIATSGWDGRSYSLGIADAVTVLARDAASADAAATLIANAVNVDHPGIRRERACDLDEDSDLGERLVTVQMPRLNDAQIEAALEAGLVKANALRARRCIEGAALALQGQWRIVGVEATAMSAPPR